MKYLMLSILFITFNPNTLFGQEDVMKSINCVILMNEVLIGKFPDIYVTIHNKDGSNNKIESGYEIGRLFFSEEDYRTLGALDNNCKISIDMTYRYQEDGGYEYKTYTKNLEIINLRQRYIVFRIYDCREKNKYKVYVETPGRFEVSPFQKERKSLNCKAIDRLMDRLVDKEEIISNQPK